MKILAHRGFWKEESEKNQLLAFERAFGAGVGIETDIRDYNGQVVISHNPASEDCPRLTELLEMWKHKGKPMLALNIKADGLYLLLEEIFERYGLDESNYFLFDASVPEEYVYLKRGYIFFSRSSEFEEKVSFFEDVNGIWLDQFTECNHIETHIESLLLSGKNIVVVSPELHKRDNTAIWELLRKYRDNDNLILCTDVPDKAKEYFDE